MVNVANFAHMTDKDVIEMCKAMNARITNQNGCQIGTLKVKCVRVLACWAQDLRNRQLPVNDTAMILLDANNSTDETDSKKSPKFKPDDWDTWEPKFMNHLKFLRGQAGTPLWLVSFETPQKL